MLVAECLPRSMLSKSSKMRKFIVKLFRELPHAQTQTQFLKTEGIFGLWNWDEKNKNKNIKLKILKEHKKF
jgi:hypothetical protein